MTTTPTTPLTRRTLTVLASLLLAAPLVAAGCGQESESGAAGAPAAGVESAAAARANGATAIDVRTPEEFADRHVEGAELIDIQDAGFADRIAALDPASTYVVYCRSGNRSAAARAQMQAAGLTVLDGGSVQDMADGGWATT